MSQINKAPPFLELSKSTIQNFDTADLDIENVLSIWTGLTKCSKFIKNGKRLENMSWRIVNRNLVYSNQIRSAASSKNLVHTDGSDNYDSYGVDVPLPGRYKPLKNKLNDADFLSLLSIVADQGFIERRPPLTRKRSSNRSLSTVRSRNRSSENVKSFENNLVRPSSFRKSSSSKSLKKMNSQKKKSHVDLPSITPIENDSDLFEQPNPRLAFGVVDKQHEDDEARPALTRNDTSTSIIRGFDPSIKPESPVKQEKVESPELQPITKSLFGNNQPNKNTREQGKAKTPSLFGNENQQLPHLHQQQQQHQFLDQQPPQPQPSLFASRAKSPLSNSQTNIEPAVVTSLFHPQQKAQNHHAAHHQSHSQVQLQQRSHAQKPKTLFDQVGISPDIKKNIQPKSKRNNVLSNLGMTSLLHGHQSQANTKSKDKSMFFIESSPSPTESVTRLGDHSNRPTSPLVPDSRSPASNDSRSHHQHDNERHHVRHQQKNLDSRESSGRSTRSKKNKSLFGEQSKTLNFSSDSSISDESDWSSVSESDDEEYDNKLRKQWEHLDFNRKEAKPQVKRSLLSGLFLNEMHDPHSQHHQYSHNHTNPSSHHSGSSTASLQYPHHPQHHHHERQEPLKSGTTTPGNDYDLSTSVQSKASIQIKHRHNSSSNIDTSVLEFSTAKPTTVISTSNVTVPGTINDKHDQHSNGDSTLKSKLSEHEHAPSTSFSNLISKSAINLTNYFASHRKNSFSSIASDRTRVKFKHESNAPPTAATLLPTALSTHMFLPNAHQRAKSRLAAVVETDSSASTTRKNSESEPVVDNVDVLPSAVPKPIKSPVLPIPHNSTKFNDAVKDDMNNFNISRKLSPKTTRRQMLATELSESLRKSILWDRKHGMYPTTTAVKPLPFPTKAEDDEVDDGHADDEEEDDETTVDQWKRKEGSLNKAKKNSKVYDQETWVEEEDTDFYTKGW